MENINQQTQAQGGSFWPSTLGSLLGGSAGPLLMSLLNSRSQPGSQYPQSAQQNAFAEQFGMPRTFQTQESSWFNDMFGTTPTSITQLPQFTLGQQSAMDQLLGDYTTRSRQLSDFSPIEEQARTGFEQKTLPTILERLQTFGGTGSSGAQQMIGQAGAGLEQSLAAMRQQFNENILNRLMQGAQMGLQPRFENVVEPGHETAGSKMLTLGTQLIGLLGGGPIGEAAAQGLTALAKKAFTKG